MADHVTPADLRQAAVWRGLRAVLPAPPAPAVAASRRPVVVDAGGGSGGFAVPLAEEGHPVVVVDPSPDALAALRRRAAERGVAARITGIQGELGDLAAVVGADAAELLLCHSVLDVVDDPPGALAGAMRALRPGGILSLVVAGRPAAVLARVLAGRFADAAELLPDGRTGARPAGPAPHLRADHPGPGRPVARFTTEEVVAMVTAAGADVLEVHGVRVFTDLVPGALVDADPRAAGRLLDLELAVATTAPFRDLATHLHVLARRRPDGRAPGGAGQPAPPTAAGPPAADAFAPGSRDGG